MAIRRIFAAGIAGTGLFSFVCLVIGTIETPYYLGMRTMLLTAVVLLSITAWKLTRLVGFSEEYSSERFSVPQISVHFEGPAEPYQIPQHGTHRRRVGVRPARIPSATLRLNEDTDDELFWEVATIEDEDGYYHVSRQIIVLNRTKLYAAIARSFAENEQAAPWERRVWSLEIENAINLKLKTYPQPRF